MCVLQFKRASLDKYKPNIDLLWCKSTTLGLCGGAAGLSHDRKTDMKPLGRATPTYLLCLWNISCIFVSLQDMPSIKATSVSCDVPFKICTRYFLLENAKLCLLSFLKNGDIISTEWHGKSPQASLCDPAAARAPMVVLTVKCQSFSGQEGVIQRQFKLLLVALMNQALEHDTQGQLGLKAPGR